MILHFRFAVNFIILFAPVWLAPYEPTNA